jgi:hypothetical protein
MYVQLTHIQYADPPHKEEKNIKPSFFEVLEAGSPLVHLPANTAMMATSIPYLLGFIFSREGR